MENKKVKNAKEHIYDGIHFKSGLEVMAYKLLKQEGFNPEYEMHTYMLQESKQFPTLHYAPFKDRKVHKSVWGLNRYKIQGLKYTPDFVFYIGDKLIVVEVKGFATDKYPYQKKLFFKWLENNNPNSIFFEVHNQKQIKAAIDIMKELNN